MALMPPRRSARLSANEHGSSSSPLAYTRVPSSRQYAAGEQSAGPSKLTTSNGKTSYYDRPASISLSHRRQQGVSKAISSSSTGRRERRFEDIASDDNYDERLDDEDNFMTGFQRPVISGNAKHAASIPVPRAPRATFYEQAGDDGFIFSSAAPATSSVTQGKRKSSGTIAGSRGPPPRASSAQHTRISDKRTAGDAEARYGEAVGGPSATPAPVIRQPRVSSSAVKAVRRVSNLRDGSAAHPHPVIADGDLHRHCSSEMDRTERLRHMANWTLNRSTKKLLNRFKGPAAAQAVLDRTLQSTLQSLSNGSLELSWPGLKAGQHSSQYKRPHPRNEANRRTERALTETVETMQQEVSRWERVKEDLRNYQLETEAIERREAEKVQQGKDGDEELRRFLLGDHDEESVKLLHDALTKEAPWLELQGEGARIGELAKDLYLSANEQPAPHAKPIKRRRTTAAQDEATDKSTCPETLRGTAADPRWNDVEWHADLLRSRTHRIGQLAVLADRYTAAVSARGAQAIEEMVDGSNKDAGVGGRGSSGPSKVSREGHQTLQRILAGIRTIESGVDGDTVLDPGHQDRRTAGPAAAVKAPGDVSEGDILRAFAGLSSGRAR